MIFMGSIKVGAQIVGKLHDGNSCCDPTDQFFCNIDRGNNWAGFWNGPRIKRGYSRWATSPIFLRYGPFGGNINDVRSLLCCNLWRFDNRYIINIPGDVMAVATTFDGYAMHRKGESRRALTMAIFASCCGG